MSTARKPITCRAAVAWEPKKPLSIETIEVAPPKEGEVRFKPNCQKCVFCKRDDTNLCDANRETQARGEMPDGTTRFTCRGRPVYHFVGCSTFSEYTVVATTSISKIDLAAPLEKVCLIGCGISTGFGAAINTARVEEGSTCAIWGLGAVGLATLMGCKAAKAKRIIAVDINPTKFDTALKFGATECVNPKDHEKAIEDVIKDMTGGGCEYTFECVGSIETMNSAYNSCRFGPSVSTVVGVEALGQTVSVSPLPFLLGRVWKGTLFGGFKGKDSVPKMVNMYMKKELMVDEFISHRFKLEQVNEAFDLMRQGKSIRSVVNVQE